MAKSARDHLLHILEELSADELEEFKDGLLTIWPDTADWISLVKLQNAKVPDLVEMLISHYHNEDSAVALTVQTLRFIGTLNLTERLNKATGTDINSRWPRFKLRATYASEAAGETSQSQSPSGRLSRQNKCDWCARDEKDLPTEVKPEVIQDPAGNQATYRVHFPRAGWFCCPETELEFKVKGTVTIEYGYGSWSQHLSESQKQQYMVAGPLFDIKVGLADIVTAIHLPHFLCLREADSSRLHIAHFSDEGMTLETPTEVRPFHAVLKNPSFSLLGLLWWWKNSDERPKNHSIVRLYQAQKRVNLTLHLYLIPDDPSRVKTVEVYEEKCRSFFMSKSHLTTKPLQFDSLYIVSSPSEITVTPKELLFVDKPADTHQPFTEIHTKDVKEELKLSLVEKKDEEPIWKCVVRPEDLTQYVPYPETEMPTGGGTNETMRDHLQNILKDLKSRELKEFKSKLTDIHLKEGYRHIPQCDLENAGPVEVTDLLIRRYGKQYAVEVTTVVLQAINERQLAETLHRSARVFRE